MYVYVTHLTQISKRYTCEVHGYTIYALIYMLHILCCDVNVTHFIAVYLFKNIGLPSILSFLRCLLLASRLKVSSVSRGDPSMDSVWILVHFAAIACKVWNLDIVLLTTVDSSLNVRN